MPTAAMPNAGELGCLRNDNLEKQSFTENRWCIIHLTHKQRLTGSLLLRNHSAESEA